MPLGGGKIVILNQKGGDVPKNSLDFERNNSDSLITNTTDFDFDALASQQKFAISAWIKLESTSSARWIFNAGDDNSANAALGWGIGANHVVFTVFDTGSVQSDLNSDTTITDTDWHHIFIKWDTTQATESDRTGIWIDGVKETTFSAENYPAQNATVFEIDATSNGILTVGEDQSGNNSFDGLLYQHAIFNNTLPDITDVYLAGSPKSVTGLAGLASELNVSGGDVTTDSVLGSIWDDTVNVPDSSATIPT